MLTLFYFLIVYGNPLSPALSVHVPDRVHLLEPPVPGGRGVVSCVEQPWAVVGGDEGREGDPVSRGAVDEQPEHGRLPQAEAGEALQEEEVGHGEEVRPDKGAVAEEPLAKLVGEGGRAGDAEHQVVVDAKWRQSTCIQVPKTIRGTYPERCLCRNPFSLLALKSRSG